MPSKPTFILLRLLGLVLLVALSASPVAAATPSPTASPKTSPKASATLTASPSASPGNTTQKLRERIERIVDEKRDQVKGALADLSQKRRGFLGEVQRVTDESITIKTVRGTQIISVTDSVTLVRKDAVINVNQIAVGEWALVIGKLVDDSFEAERIFVSATSLLPKRPVITIGTIAEINKTTLTMIPRSGGNPQLYTLGKNTVYQDGEGNTIKQTVLSKDIQVVVVGYPNENLSSPPTAKIIKLLSSAPTQE